MAFNENISKFQDELKIGDDDFENLQSLYQLFDLDKDGILNFKEYEKLLRCLGYRLSGKNKGKQKTNKHSGGEKRRIHFESADTLQL